MVHGDPGIVDQKMQDRILRENDIDPASIGTGEGLDEAVITDIIFKLSENYLIKQGLLQY